MFFRFKKVDSLFCSYCNEEEEETPLHLFHYCLKPNKYGTNSPNTCQNL